MCVCVCVCVGGWVGVCVRVCARARARLRAYVPASGSSLLVFNAHPTGTVISRRSWSHKASIGTGWPGVCKN